MAIYRCSHENNDFMNVEKYSDNEMLFECSILAREDYFVVLNRKEVVKLVNQLTNFLRETKQ